MTKTKQKSRLHISNKQNDARYVELGKHLVLSESPNKEDELKKANKNKNGHPFVYAESLFQSLAIIRSYCGLSYRILEGVAIQTIGKENAPSYSQIQKRVTKIKILKTATTITAYGKRSIMTVSIDGTGLSPSARSEYIHIKHKVKHGFIRFTIAVDTDTREILALTITDDKVGEAPQFETLMTKVLEDDKVIDDKVIDDDKSITVFGDGAYDSNKIFDYCKKNGITPCIRIRNNASLNSDDNSKSRSSAISDQLGDDITDPVKFAQLTKKEREANRKKWKKQVQYGKRWMAEIVISSFKRQFGDSVAAKKWSNVIQEINCKVMIYNQMLKIQREAINNA